LIDLYEIEMEMKINYLEDQTSIWWNQDVDRWLRVEPLMIKIFPLKVISKGISLDHFIRCGQIDDFNTNSLLKK
jgi:hypothetical protein